MSEEAAAFLRARRRPLKLVIFDCDGVLIDSEALSNRVLAEMLREDGWNLSREEADQRFIGFSFGAVKLMAEAHLGRSLGADWVTRLVTRVVDVMRDDAEPIPGAREALDAVTGFGLPWRIASNSSFLEMDAKFGRTGWRDLVAGRVHSAAELVRLGGAAKPAPDVFLAAASAEGVAPAHCLVIEDSVAGVTAAAAAGMDCLGLARHGDGEDVRAAGAIPFRSMHDLPDLLRAALV
jgi:beta-phosphoglucomutase-like phosphatase (HAD superfamily)